jgi:hypothetical protein
METCLALATYEAKATLPLETRLHEAEKPLPAEENYDSLPHGVIAENH